MSGTKYLGSCFERCQMKDGSFQVLKLFVYWVSGERRLALTEEAARAAVTA
jgi:hypothetical protein